MLSGGNCGKGAAAAALSEAAVQAGYIKPAQIGTWGSAVGTAEAGLVGGATSAITGGKFSDGFSTAAAGYLFNSALHYGETKNADFNCGKTSCEASLSTFDNEDAGQVGLRIKVSPDDTYDGGAWVQTFTRYAGPFAGQVYDNDGAVNTLYPGYGTNSDLFADSPSMNKGDFGVFTAQTSYVVPNSTGGYTALYTFQWGFTYTPNGVTPIFPRTVSPNSFQSGAIHKASHQ